MLGSAIALSEEEKEKRSIDTSNLFETPWGKKYKEIKGKIFQIIPAENINEQFMSPLAIFVTEILSIGEKKYVFKHASLKVFYGEYVVYIKPMLHKLNRYDNIEPLLFGHIVLHKNNIIFISPDNINLGFF